MNEEAKPAYGALTTVDIYIDAVICPACGRPFIVRDLDIECNWCKAKFVIKVERVK